MSANDPKRTFSRERIMPTRLWPATRQGSQMAKRGEETHRRGREAPIRRGRKPIDDGSSNELPGSRATPKKVQHPRADQPLVVVVDLDHACSTLGAFFLGRHASTLSARCTVTRAKPTQRAVFLFPISRNHRCSALLRLRQTLTPKAHQPVRPCS
jgi:hypothetical protein